MSLLLFKKQHVSGFDPFTQVQKLERWYDFSDLTSLEFDSSNRISYVRDKSVLHRDAFQASDANKPLTRQLYFKGNSPALFDNTDYLASTIGMQTPNGVSAWVVVRRNVIDSSFRIALGRWRSAGNRRSFVMGKNNLGRLYSQFSIDGTGPNSVSMISSVNDNDVHVMQFAHNGSTRGFFYVDGVEIDNEGGNLFNPSEVPISVGQADPGITPGWIDAIGEVIISSHFYTQEESVPINQYLMDKWT